MSTSQYEIYFDNLLSLLEKNFTFGLPKCWVSCKPKNIFRKVVSKVL